MPLSSRKKKRGRPPSKLTGSPCRFSSAMSSLGCGSDARSTRSSSIPKLEKHTAVPSNSILTTETLGAITLFISSESDAKRKPRKRSPNLIASDTGISRPTSIVLEPGNPDRRGGGFAILPSQRGLRIDLRHLAACLESACQGWTPALTALSSAARAGKAAPCLSCSTRFAAVGGRGEEKCTRGGGKFTAERVSGTLGGGKGSRGDVTSICGGRTSTLGTESCIYEAETSTHRMEFCIAKPVQGTLATEKFTCEAVQGSCGMEFFRRETRAGHLRGRIGHLREGKDELRGREGQSRGPVGHLRRGDLQLRG